MVDCFRSVEIEKDDNLLLYLADMSFFPVISSGPISNIKDLEKQLNSNFRISKSNAYEGLYFLISGLFMKFVIANRCTDIVNNIFTNPASYSGLSSLMGTFLNTIEIYLDFAGYSYIAYASALFIGIRVNRNFNLPYFSLSIKEFWNRWHMSLSGFLKNYVYIPLGGNRKGTLFKIINTVIVFFVSALWHGFSYNYLVWGILNGTFVILSFSDNKHFKILKTGITFIIINILWIFFRTASLSDAFTLISNIFTNLTINESEIISTVLLFTSDMSSFSYCLILGIMIAVLFIKELLEYSNKNTPIFENIFIVIMVFSIIVFGIFGTSSFIYTQF